MRYALLKARKSNGMSVSEISKLLGISASFYYKIESGIRNPTINLAKQISALLDSDIDTLFFAVNLDELSS